MSSYIMKLTLPNSAGSVDMKRMFNRPTSHHPVNNVYHENTEYNARHL